MPRPTTIPRIHMGRAPLAMRMPISRRASASTSSEMTPQIPIVASVSARRWRHQAQRQRRETGLGKRIASQPFERAHLGEGKIRIDRPHGFPHVAENGKRIAVGPSTNVIARRVPLPAAPHWSMGHAYLGARLFGDRVVSNLPDHADDGDPRIAVAVGAEPFADRVVVRPVAPGHRVVDDCHHRRVFIVGLGDESSGRTSVIPMPSK